MSKPTEQEDKITVEQEFAQYQRQITQLEQQLAAEREKSRVLGNIIDGKGGLRDIIREHQAEYDRLSAIIEKDTLRIVELEEQLAAVREKHERFEQIYDENPSLYRLAEEVVELRDQLVTLRELRELEQKQLAAERESYTSALELANRRWIDCQQQLAAAVEALERIGLGHQMPRPDHAARNALAVLAKIGEGKK